MFDDSVFKNKKAVYCTLGCKLNFAETSTIGRQLAELGVVTAAAGEKADFCVINTCSVTELAEKKCRQAIRRLNRQYPEAFVIAVGCYAQLNPETVSRIEGVDLVLGTREKGRVAEILEAALAGKSGCGTLKTVGDFAVSPVKNAREFIPSCAKGDRTRFFLKVQDGCDYFCSYCTIPYARGRSRSGDIASLVKMAEEAGREGGKEIVLTGVNIGDFGKTTGETFFELIKALDKVETVERYRISSIEPNLLTDEILDFIVHSQRFTPHFHIPLQSGSDAVLRLMRRKYDTALFAAKIHRIKDLMPDAFIGVDTIVGMRGETEAYFLEAEQFIESLPITRLHVFPYSERPGTAALNIAHTVNPQEKQERSKRLIEISDRKLSEFYRSQVGTEHKVLFEHTKKGEKMFGFTENYARVETLFNKLWINQLIPLYLQTYNEKEMTMSV
jgi:threonylcarbamoyladenosine tRNA methylthiotransferase MtaB